VDVTQSVMAAVDLLAMTASSAQQMQREISMDSVSVFHSIEDQIAQYMLVMAT
jgi:hypothetical protein